MALALDPVSAAVYTALNVAAVTSLAPGGVSDDPAQGTTFPFVWFELQEQDLHAFGTGYLPEFELRVHIYSATTPLVAQQVGGAVLSALKDVTLTVAGFRPVASVVYEDAVPLPDQLLNGVKVHELVLRFRLWVEL